MGNAAPHQSLNTSLNDTHKKKKKTSLQQLRSCSDRVGPVSVTFAMAELEPSSVGEKVTFRPFLCNGEPAGNRGRFQSELPSAFPRHGTKGTDSRACSPVLNYITST